MTKWKIIETVEYIFEADTAEDAMQQLLNAEDFAGVISAREVYLEDEDGNSEFATAEEEKEEA